MDDVKSLKAAQERYRQECSQRERDAERYNEEVATLKANLGYGVPEAVDEYISLVLSNSVYPDHFPVEHEFGFNAETAELRLRVAIPDPSTLPGVKTHGYKKSSDEMTETPLPQKVRRDQYASAVHQVALRSLHEVFEADRRGLIATVSLKVGTNAADPATGIRAFIPFVVVGAERDSFLALALANVVPSATLEHLGAGLSKNPFALQAVDATGIRRS
jgi:restriction system protein